MNKISMIAILLMMTCLQVQASEQKNHYEYNCHKPGYITKYCANGVEEEIALQPDENPREKIRELQNNDRVSNSRPSDNVGIEKEEMRTCACFSSNAEFVESENAKSSGIPTILVSEAKIEEMVNGPQ